MKFSGERSAHKRNHGLDARLRTQFEAAVVSRMILSVAVIAWLLTPRLAAQAQSAQDEFETGKRFFNGTPGVQRDPVKGADWYRKAAEQGYAPAQFAYADCLRDGAGIRQDGVAARA